MDLTRLFLKEISGMIVNFNYNSGSLLLYVYNLGVFSQISDGAKFTKIWKMTD